MSFKSLLNKTCVIEVSSETQNPATGQKEKAYSVLYSGVKCRIRNRETSERIYSEKQYQKATHALYLESLPLDITKTRVVLEGAVYTAVGLIDLGGKEKYLCLYLERYF